MSLREKILKMPLAKRRRLAWLLIGGIMAVIVLFFIFHWVNRFEQLGQADNGGGDMFSELAADLRTTSEDLGERREVLDKSLEELRREQEEASILLQTQYPAVVKTRDGIEVAVLRIDFYIGSARVYFTAASKSGAGGSGGSGAKFRLGEIVEQETGARGGVPVYYPKRYYMVDGKELTDDEEVPAELIADAEMVIVYPAIEPNEDFVLKAPGIVLENGEKILFEFEIEGQE